MQIYCKGEREKKQKTKTKHHRKFILHSAIVHHLYLVSSVDLSSAESHSVGW